MLMDPIPVALFGTLALLAFALAVRSTREALREDRHPGRDGGGDGG